MQNYCVSVSGKKRLLDVIGWWAAASSGDDVVEAVQKRGRGFNSALAFGKHKMKARCAWSRAPADSMTNLIQMYNSTLFFIIIFFLNIIMFYKCFIV